jgi:thioredoxin-related protein
MKKDTLSVRVLITVSLAFIAITKIYGQETNFTTVNSFEEAKQFAVKGQKLILIDFYTDWCGPCKRMDKEVFTQNKVGRFLNDRFINIKIDAEKGEGKNLSKQFHVRVYPTYLFLNSQGVPIYKATGYSEAEEMIKHASNAIKESAEPLTIYKMDSLYKTQKKNKAFMYDYLVRRTKLKLENADLLDEYCRMLTKQEATDLKTIQLIADNGDFLTQTLQIGPALDILKQHKELIDSVKTEQDIDIFISNAIDKTLSKAIREKNDSLLKLAILNADLSEEIYNGHHRKVLTLAYLKGTDQNTKYITKAIAYMDNDLMMVDYNNLKKTDAVGIVKMINNTSRNILDVSSNEISIKKTLAWTERSMKIAEMDLVYFKEIYPACLHIYAYALYRSGNKTEAINQQTKAISLLGKMNDRRQKIYSEELENMHKNIPRFTIAEE